MKNLSAAVGGVFVVENRSRERTMSDVTSTEVVSFWREAGPERWFGKDEGFDLTIRTRFLAPHEAAARAELAAWEEGAEGARYQYFYSTPS
jgi:uncharacterized protein (DUF924 family)